MRELPMLFSDAMVLAIRADKKHQTRRLRFSGQPGDVIWIKEAWQTHERESDNVDGIRFRADDAFVPIENTRQAADLWFDVHSSERSKGRLGQWRPSIYMRRWMARTLLVVKDVRAEQLQEISAEDALAEGVAQTAAWRPKDVDENPKPTHEWAEPYWDDFYFWHHYPQRAFREVWDEINGRRAPWESNPVVQVVSFELKRGG